MEIIYEGPFDYRVYYNSINIVNDSVIVQTVYPPTPKNYIHTYKGNCFTEADNIVIYKENGEVYVNAV